MNRLLRGVALLTVLLMSIGCSTLNEDHPDVSEEKCDICHMFPPRDSSQFLVNDTLMDSLQMAEMKSIHFIHVTFESLTCDICHEGYDNKTGKWSIPGNHRNDMVSYNDINCIKCHKYRDCNSCHATPPSEFPQQIQVHDLHLQKVDPVTGDTTGYRCGYCHKGYDIENMTSPLDLPRDKHDNGIVDVDFDLPFPGDPLSAPVYDRKKGTCSYVYCHGTTITGGKKVVSIGSPVDTLGSAECNFCHDTLKLATEVGEHTREDHVENFKDCMNCHHAGYLLKNGSTNNKYHINGKIDFDLCNNCHEIPSGYQMSSEGVITKSVQ